MKQAGWTPKRPSVVLRRTDSSPRGSACIHALLRCFEIEVVEAFKDGGITGTTPLFIACCNQGRSPEAGAAIAD